ncbi:FtsW/RodA/SpoVE family cell cycle protein [Paenibacillus thalictri]|uniref:FtsW/RodA/SpoVE family cell cycle protein n=1 Tax=Paenibacillus thalictri TaxID=2527873 RepID=A0A4Q9DWB8_9BACL|nr:FtsW/RodA/SpoVE family cell cycle protein [Paenibacillus thalictri]TBL81364.1 FtsW/RodA/SpoVE family cell cycle protein [Paenibacillus thalictri]
MIRHHDAIRAYLNEVCSRIRAREAHRDIRRELESHLEELVLERETAGASRDEAVGWAVQQMGSATEVGDKLHRIHRPRIHWGLLAGVLLFLSLGILAMYTVEAGTTAEFKVRYMQRTLVYASVGLLVMTGLYFFNYAKLRKYSMAIYVVTVCGIIGTQIFGAQVNGLKYWHIASFTLDWVGISPYLLIISAPGLLMKWRKQNRFWLRALLAFFVIPAVLFMLVSSLSNLLLYMTGYLILLIFVTGGFKATLAHGAAMAVAFTLLIASNPHSYILNRLFAFLNAADDPRGAGYVYMMLDSVLKSAGWLGHGISAPAGLRLPGIATDNVLAYLIYCFGWWFGIAVLFCFVYFIGRLVHSNRAVTDPYGQLLSAAVAGMLGFQMLYCFMMPFGWVPFLGIPFPFLSYGGSHLLVEMAVVGLLLGIYRRKDLLRISDSQAIED